MVVWKVVNSVLCSHVPLMLNLRQPTVRMLTRKDTSLRMVKTVGGGADDRNKQRLRQVRVIDGRIQV